MIDQKDTAPKHAAVDGPTLPNGVVVKVTDGGRRYAIEPDEQPTQAFLDGFEDAAAEHTAELEALAAGKGTRVTAFFAMVWFRMLAFFGWIVDEVATTVRLSARWELEHSRTIARIVVATLSALVVAGTGIGAWFL
ncbi:hypothetical protein DMC63_01545 [Streptomyces sp. WAC 05977]|nr:hypothetical protein DMC63_01545 [Streptomyces sp. WAC 05977]